MYLSQVSLSVLLDELLLVCEENFDKKQTQNNIILDEHIRYLMREQELFIDNKLVDLTTAQRLVLELLISKKNHIVSNEEITAYLYSKNIDIEIENIRKLVYKVRKKLLNDEIIQTIHSQGYRLRVKNC